MDIDIPQGDCKSLKVVINGKVGIEKTSMRIFGENGSFMDDCVRAPNVCNPIDIRHRSPWDSHSSSVSDSSGSGDSTRWSGSRYGYASYLRRGGDDGSEEGYGYGSEGEDRYDSDEYGD